MSEPHVEVDHVCDQWVPVTIDGKPEVILGQVFRPSVEPRLSPKCARCSNDRRVHRTLCLFIRNVVTDEYTAVVKCHGKAIMMTFGVGWPSDETIRSTVAFT